MGNRLRSRLTYTNVVGTIALLGVFAAGGAYAAATTGARDIKNNAVRGRHIKNNQVTGADVNEARLDATALRTRVARGGCQGAVAGTGTMVKVGPLCIDRYEASVWSRPNGGVQYGVASDDYPCADNGQDCKGKIFARSVPGVTPSRYITWFQAQQALANSGKRVPTNAEWQMAVAGTPDSSACNVTSGIANTGAFATCRSAWGANDMVGNLWELVADWLPVSDAGGGCPGWGGFSDDFMCRSGVSTVAQGPGISLRGGGNDGGPGAGPFAMGGAYEPTFSISNLGLRGAL